MNFIKLESGEWLNLEHATRIAPVDGDPGLYRTMMVDGYGHERTAEPKSFAAVDPKGLAKTIREGPQCVFLHWQ